MRINVSRLQEFMKCPQKYKYRFEMGVVPREEEREALDFGTKIHEGLRVWYQEKSVEGAVETFNKTEPLEHPMRGYGEVMVRDYVKRYYLEDMVMRTVGVEQEMEAPFGGHILQGRLDLIVEMEQAGGKHLWHVQHKTVGNTVGMENYVRQYDLAWHERAYLVLAKHNGMETEGTILNILRKTKIPSFLRVYLPMTEELLRRFEEDFVKIMRLIEDREYRPQSPEACWNYQRMCPDQSLCMGVPIMEEDWKEREPDYVDEAVEKDSEEAHEIGG